MGCRGVGRLVGLVVAAAQGKRYESGNVFQAAAWKISLGASLVDASRGPYDSRLHAGSHGSPAFALVVVVVDEESYRVLDVVFGFGMKTADGLASSRDELCVSMSRVAIPPVQAPSG